MSALAHPPAEDPVRRIEALSEQNLWACYQCGKCTADCPFSLSPSLVIRMLQLGQADAARSLDTTWECAACYTCQTGCPKGVSPTRVMKVLRSLDGGRPPEALARVDGNGGSDGFAVSQAVRPRRFAPWARLEERLRSARTHLMASQPDFFRRAQRFAVVSNLLPKLPGARLFAHLVLGIHRKRPLPPFAGVSFPDWFRSHTQAGDGHRGRVLLFHDTLMDCSYPQVGIAAAEVLEGAGFRVELTNSVCCGRPAISKGLTAKASRCARENVRRLYPAASEGTWIVGCEPSCLLSFRDEYPHLVPPEMEEQARVVARQALLIDEFLAMLVEKGEMELAFGSAEGRRPILFHGHCHQKAFASPAKSMAVLEAAGYDVSLVNAACCGMAGAYGFEKEHYEASRAAGERALFPAIRANPDADLVVIGVSCRQQIEHFTGRPTRHFIEAVRDAVAPRVAA